MRLRMVFKKRLNRKQILTPVMSNLKNGVMFLSQLIDASFEKATTRGSSEKIERIVQESIKQNEADKVESAQMDGKICDAIERELMARPNDPHAHVEPHSFEDESSNARGVRARRAP